MVLGAFETRTWSPFDYHSIQLNRRRRQHWKPKSGINFVVFETIDSPNLFPSISHSAVSFSFDRGLLMGETFGKGASGGQTPQDFFASEGLCLIPGSGASHRFDFQMDVKIRNYQRVSRGRVY